MDTWVVRYTVAMCFVFCEVIALCFNFYAFFVCEYKVPPPLQFLMKLKSKKPHIDMVTMMLLNSWCLYCWLRYSILFLELLRLIAVNMEVCYWTLSWASSNETTLLPSFFLRCISILSSSMHIGHQSGFFSWGFLIKILFVFVISPLCLHVYFYCLDCVQKLSESEAFGANLQHLCIIVA
jgi:hypothetical protein